MSYSGHGTCAGCGGSIQPGPRITVPGLDGQWHLHCPEHAWMAIAVERAAKIAEHSAEEAKAVGLMHPEDSDSRSRCFAQSRKGHEIAKLIREI